MRGRSTVSHGDNETMLDASWTPRGDAVTEMGPKGLCRRGERRGGRVALLQWQWLAGGTHEGTRTTQPRLKGSRTPRGWRRVGDGVGRGGEVERYPGYSDSGHRHPWYDWEWGKWNGSRRGTRRERKSLPFPLHDVKLPTLRPGGPIASCSAAREGAGRGLEEGPVNRVAALGGQSGGSMGRGKQRRNGRGG